MQAIAIHVILAQPARQPFTEDIPMKLKQYREAMNISAKDAARDLSTTTVTLWRWETGKSIPDVYSMRQIVKWSKGTVTANDFYEV